MKRIAVIIMTLMTMAAVSSFVFAGTGRRGGGLESLWKRYDKAMDSDRIQNMADILEDIKTQALKENAPWNYIKACEEYVSVRSRKDWRLTDSLVKTLDRIPDELGSEYPGIPYLRYRGIISSYDGGRKEKLQELAADYAGRGISLLAEDKLLLIKFYESTGADASSDDYRELEKEALALKERCGVLKGDETVVADMCGNYSYILEQLNSVGATGRIVDGRAVLALRNLGKVGFRIEKDGRTIFDTVAVNETKSFYRQDTVCIDIPVLEDGSYTALILDGDKTVSEVGYDKYTVSVAGRHASDGMCIYAADYMSGKPLEKADLLVYDKDMDMVAEIRDFGFDGFTPLPEEIYPFRDKGWYYIVCRYSDGGMVRMSRRMSLRNEDGHVDEGSTYIDAVVLKDRAAFVPGDTLKFKAILYEVSPDGGMRTVPEGYETVARIYDPQMEMISEMTLVTNEFGSVAGSFAIGREIRNGNYEVRVYGGREILGSGMFRVDDFVLPTYDLSFDKADRLYFPGDEVTVRGRVRNFTGHGFSGLKAVAELDVKYEKVGEIPVSIAPDGSFEVSFKAGEPDDDYVSYGVILRLTDSTGETLSFDYRSGASNHISLEATLCNSDPLDDFEVDVRRTGFGRFTSGKVLSEEAAEILCCAGGYGDGNVDVSIDYELIHEGKVVESGRTRSGDTLSIDMSSLASGLYGFEMKASSVTDSGRSVSSSRICRMLYLREDDEVVPCVIDRVFRAKYEDGEIVMQIGSGTGPIWASVELFGHGNEVLKKEMVHVDGKAGEAGSLVTVVFPHLEEYSDDLHLSLVYFRNGERYYYRRNFSRPEPSGGLSLEFSVFEDKVYPGQECTVRLKTGPGTEVVASVFDVSSEQIMNNAWRTVRHDEKREVYVNYSWSTGQNGGYLMSVRGYGASKKSKTTGNLLRMDAVAADSAVAEEEAVPFQLVAGGLNNDVEVRDDFSTTLAFKPFMRSSSDGSVDFKFRTSDKLSTFIVKVYAHDRSMNNSVVGREMLVTLPVKVSVVPPQYLYEGDRYVLDASVSNASESSLKGSVYLEVYDGEEYADAGPVRIDSCLVEVPAGGSVSSAFEVPVPSGVGALGFKIVFVGYEYSSSMPVNDVLISDGMFVPVPVLPAAQVLTEAHSAVLPGGGSVEEVLERLRGEFVNVQPTGAEYMEISVMDMIRETLPGDVEVDGKNAVSLSEGMYVNLLAAGLWAQDMDSAGVVESCVDAAMGSVSELLGCADADGGFSWFENGSSSPVITALVLERYAGLRDRGLLDVVSELEGEDALDALDAAVAAAVEYLDSSFFGEKDRPLWYGRLSLGQYLNVRSMFAGIPFDETAARKAAGRKGYREFQKEVKAYLIPKETGTSGDVLSKVRAVRTIIGLLDGTPQGFALRDAWGISSAGDVRRMVKVRDRELISLKQYAVEHPSGGIYYPNAVMPWRGLLESEAYAHARICDLLSDVSDSYYGDWSLDGLADGIRVWLMLQKETQEWSADPGFVEALASVMDGSETVRDTEILVLKKRYMKPFDRIEASGNGFRISVDYYKDGSDIPLSEGDSLHVGDRITAVYSLWSGENRSHVRLSVPRAACFRPAEQLSGWSGGWMRPFMNGGFMVSPYSYREVRAGRTLWWIDVFPEQEAVVKEQLFVTQEGTFTAPVAEIESLYAPHYRANDGFEGYMNVSE